MNANLSLLPFSMLPRPVSPLCLKYLNHIWFRIKCFLWLLFQSIFLCYNPPPPLFLFGLFLSDPDLSLQTKGFEIYDHVSDTYLESYLQKASLYLKLSLCSFAELPQHSLEDLVRCHCNSLFLMFLMFIPHHPCSLFIFPFTCFRAPPSHPLCLCVLENRCCLLDRNTAQV